MTDFTPFINSLSAGPTLFGQVLSEVFRGWRNTENFSCAGFASLMEEHIGAPSNPDIKASTIAALKLADETSGNGYHNHHHNREVVALTFALLVRHAHNNLGPIISTDMMWLTLAAAAIHDYKHDGTTNRTGDEVSPMRLERLALHEAKPELMSAGLYERDWLKLSMIVLPTDITATELPSPSAQLKDIFLYHTGREKNLGEIDPTFLLLLYDSELAACGEILSDADLGVSAGLDIAIARINSAGLAIETSGAIPATNGSLNFFLNHVCQGFPGSPSGRILLSEGFGRIKSLISHELEHGIKPGIG